MKLILAKEVVVLGNPEKDALLKIDKQMKSIDQIYDSYASIITSYFKIALIFFTKIEDESEIIFPILDTHNWNEYLQFNDLNSLLIKIQIFNNYYNDIELKLLQKSNTIEDKKEDSYLNIDQNEERSQSKVDKELEIQYYTDIIQKLKNDIVLLNQIDNKIFKNTLTLNKNLKH